jgi:hypothetical protein
LYSLIECLANDKVIIRVVSARSIPVMQIDWRAAPIGAFFVNRS